MWVDIAENVFRIRGHRSGIYMYVVQMYECCNGGGTHFDGVASRLACFMSTHFCTEMLSMGMISVCYWLNWSLVTRTSTSMGARSFLLPEHISQTTYLSTYVIRNLPSCTGPNKLLTRRSATADRKCASNMALSHGGGAKSILIWNRLGADRGCDKDVRTAPSVKLV